MDKVTKTANGHALTDLIAALQIFQRYGNPRWPTHCEHDVLYVLIHPDIVSLEDKALLSDLGFEPDEEDLDCFRSFRFGSA